MLSACCLLALASKLMPAPASALLPCPAVLVELGSLAANPPTIYPAVLLANALAAFALNLVSDPGRRDLHFIAVASFNEATTVAL